MGFAPGSHSCMPRLAPLSRRASHLNNHPLETAVCRTANRTDYRGSLRGNSGNALLVWDHLRLYTTIDMSTQVSEDRTSQSANRPQFGVSAFRLPGRGVF